MQPLTDEQRQIVEDKLGLVGSFVRRHCGSTLDRDDLYQNCALMLITAFQGWKPERGAFSTWAHWAMRAALQQTLRRRSLVTGVYPRPTSIPIDEPFDGDGLTLEEQIGDPHNVEADVELDTKRRAWAALPHDSRQREILLRRADGDTLQEIGDDMALSRERVRQLEAVALGTARRRLLRATAASSPGAA